VEIKIALDAFAAPLTQITNQLVGTLPQQKDKKVLEQLFTLLEEAMSIFYSLNYQGVCVRGLKSSVGCNGRTYIDAQSCTRKSIAYGSLPGRQSLSILYS
jgi:hypothetical protein